MPVTGMVASLAMHLLCGRIRIWQTCWPIGGPGQIIVGIAGPTLTDTTTSIT